jgi:type I restriction enzyme R subunit
MKGRGVRVISPDKLKAVTRTAKAKERFIIVDAVGVCEQDKTDSCTLNRKPSATLPELLEYVAQGGTDPDALTTLAGRLARLQREFSPAQLAELRDLAGGKSFPDLAGDLMRAVDPDAQIAAAKESFATDKPTEEQIATATEQLAQMAVTPFLKAAFRRRILEIRVQNEQTIDRHSIDDVLYAGFDATAVEKAQAKVKDFRAWIAANKDQLTALQIIYSGTKPLKLSLKDLRQLKEALTIPPLAASPTQLWRAFQIVETSMVAEASAQSSHRPGEQLADLVSLVRHAIAPDYPLQPYGSDVLVSYVRWKRERAEAGVVFTAEQLDWLDRMAEHIATSLAIDTDDFQDGWFGQHGSLGKAYALFGEKLKPLLAELNETLAA